MLLNDDCFRTMEWMADDSIDLIITDPPYDLNTESWGNKRGDIAPGIKKKAKEIAFMADGFDVSRFFISARRILKKFQAYIFCSNKQIYPILRVANEYKYLTTVLIWHKVNAVPAGNKTWGVDIEYCIHIREEGAYFNPPSAVIARKVYSSTTINKDKWHPAQKPIDLLEKYIMCSSKRGETILDPFMGSGSTGIACHNLGRKFIGVEADPEIYSRAQERFNIHCNQTVIEISPEDNSLQFSIDKIETI